MAIPVGGDCAATPELGGDGAATILLSWSESGGGDGVAIPVGGGGVVIPVGGDCAATPGLGDDNAATTLLSWSVGDMGSHPNNLRNKRRMSSLSQPGICVKIRR